MPEFKLTDAHQLQLDADLVEMFLSHKQFRNRNIDQNTFREAIEERLLIEYTEPQLLAVRNELILRGVIEMVST